MEEAGGGEREVRTVAMGGGGGWKVSETERCSDVRERRATETGDSWMKRRRWRKQ